jgi:hypothetical protein
MAGISKSKVKVFAIHVVVTDGTMPVASAETQAKWMEHLSEEPHGLPQDRTVFWFSDGNWDLATDGPDFWSHFLEGSEQRSSRFSS